MKVATPYSPTSQETCDLEALLLCWYHALKEERASGKYERVRVTHQPSGDQLRFWLQEYGFACTEDGLHNGLVHFLKKKNGIVVTDQDDLYMIR